MSDAEESSGDSDELALSLAHKCCRCKTKITNQWTHAYEDQNTLKIYCPKHQHIAPRKAKLVKIEIVVKNKIIS